MQKSGKSGGRKLAILAMMAAAAYVVMYLSKLIPIHPVAAPYLSFDLKDVVICIAGFLFGALPAAGISVVVSLIEMVTVSTTGPWGLLMNILSTCAFACLAAFIYQKWHTIHGAVAGLVGGVLLMTAVMLLWNYLITPIYTGAPRAAIASMLVPVFLPFNLIKGGINAAATFLIYKPVARSLRKARLVDESSAPGSAGGRKTGAVIVTAVVLATLILLALVLGGVI